MDVTLIGGKKMKEMTDYPVITLQGKGQGSYEFHILPLNYEYHELMFPGIFVISRSEYSKKDGRKYHTILYVGMTNNFSGALSNNDVIQLSTDVDATNFLLQYCGDKDTRSAVKEDIIRAFKPPINRDGESYTKRWKLLKQQAENKQNPIEGTTQTSNHEPALNTRQCGTCYGSGTVTCSACGGSGGHQETRVDYDWEGNPQYNYEYISCYMCSGGSVNCSTCGGKGYVYT